MRVGFGLDFHRFSPERKLILGGVEIPYEKGLAGHSDADVLSHAICDALLGAAGLGDLGQHFPDTDPTFLGISSLVLLEEVLGLLRARGYRINNIDATIVAQEPKLAPYLPQMAERLATALEIKAGMINIKATRPEGLGALGRGEGLAAYAIAVLVAPDELEDVVISDEEHESE
ncbi:MAG: 2-C-methyl-D-erythritol 2,4-cyclodiphosphate synthase [Candidatus Bipolaricaulia bacterium]